MRERKTARGRKGKEETENEQGREVKDSGGGRER